MFLEMLSDFQRELFLHLAICAAKANNIVDEAEKEMILRFAKEMDIEPITNTDKNADEVIRELKESCGDLERKIILFEIIGIILSDQNCDELEKRFLNNLAAKFEITEETVNNMISLVREYTGLYNRIFDTVIRS